MLSEMGITTLTLADGRVQLLHTFSNVISFLYKLKLYSFRNKNITFSRQKLHKILKKDYYLCKKWLSLV